MVDIKEGDKVKWVTKMMAVPHPEGKTDRAGVVLPVFRDTERIGTVISAHCARNKYSVRPDNLACAAPKGMDTYYDLSVSLEELTKI
jgi:hypothetical protein